MVARTLTGARRASRPDGLSALGGWARRGPSRRLRRDQRFEGCAVRGRAASPPRRAVGSSTASGRGGKSPWALHARPLRPRHALRRGRRRGLVALLPAARTLAQGRLPAGHQPDPSRRTAAGLRRWRYVENRSARPAGPGMRWREIAGGLAMRRIRELGMPTVTQRFPQTDYCRRAHPCELRCRPDAEPVRESDANPLDLLRRHGRASEPNSPRTSPLPTSRRLLTVHALPYRHQCRQARDQGV